MKTLKSLRFLGAALLGLSLAGIPAMAQTSQDSQQQPPSQSQPDPSADRNAQQVQNFTGTVIKTTDGFVLQDNAAKTAYKLDNKMQAKKFEGKSVKVSGTLDPSTGTIHIASLEPLTSY